MSSCAVRQPRLHPRRVQGVHRARSRRVQRIRRVSALCCPCAAWGRWPSRAGRPCPSWTALDLQSSRTDTCSFPSFGSDICTCRPYRTSHYPPSKRRLQPGTDLERLCHLALLIPLVPSPPRTLLTSLTLFTCCYSHLWYRGGSQVRTARRRRYCRLLPQRGSRSRRGAQVRLPSLPCFSFASY